jgi:hypothetical protein
MTVSGTNTFNLVTSQIVTKAFRILGVATSNRAPTAADMTSGIETLNIMLKSWKNAGTYLWKTNQATLFLVNGQASYKLDGSTANVTDEYSETTVDGDVISGASSIIVNDADGFVVGYFIGVEQDDETIHWTTISSVVGTTIGLTAALTAAVSSDNKVWAYQTKVGRPERVLSARYIDSNDNLSPCTMLARDTYYNLPDKNNTGQVTQVYYEPKLTYGTIFVYNTPSVVGSVVKFTYEVQFFDFDTLINTADFPTEWLLPIIYNLAYLLSFEYGISEERLNRIEGLAVKSLEDAQGYDRENTAIFFQPATETYIGQFN